MKGRRFLRFVNTSGGITPAVCLRHIGGGAPAGRTGRSRFEIQVSDRYVRNQMRSEASWTEAREVSSRLSDPVATARTCLILLKNIATWMRCL